jgi:hypothetical protein
VRSGLLAVAGHAEVDGPLNVAAGLDELACTVEPVGDRSDSARDRALRHASASTPSPTPDTRPAADAPWPTGRRPVSNSKASTPRLNTSAWRRQAAPLARSGAV